MPATITPQRIGIAAIVGGLVITGVVTGIMFTSGKIRTLEKLELDQGAEIVIDKETTVEGDVILTNGTLEMKNKPLRVKGNFYLGKDADIILGSAPLIFEGDAIIHVEKKSRKTGEIEYIFTGAFLNCNGCIPNLISSGSELIRNGTNVLTEITEEYIPSLGHVIIMP